MDNPHRRLQIEHNISAVVEWPAIFAVSSCPWLNRLPDIALRVHSSSKKILDGFTKKPKSRIHRQYDSYQGRLMVDRIFHLSVIFPGKR